MNYRLIYRIGFTALTPLCCFILGSCRQEKKPNVIFILADDLGYSDLGCYGSTFY